MKKSIKLLEVTVLSGQQTTTTKHFHDSQSSGYERLAAIEIAIAYLIREKQQYIV